MGTRSLIAVRLDGEYKLAQYCHLDGYPEGQGAGVLQFLTERMDRERFTGSLRKLTYIDDKSYEEIYMRYGCINGSMRIDDYDRMSMAYPQLSRDTGSDILMMVQDETIQFLRDSISFAADSLFCEYAWVIDLDANTFEGYRGFNHDPLTETDRFFFLEGVSEKPYREEQYHPVKLVKAWRLDALPTLQELSDAFYEEEE